MKAGAVYNALYHLKQRAKQDVCSSLQVGIWSEEATERGIHKPSTPEELERQLDRLCLAICELPELKDKVTKPSNLNEEEQIGHMLEEVKVYLQSRLLAH